MTSPGSRPMGSQRPPSCHNAPATTSKTPNPIRTRATGCTWLQLASWQRLKPSGNSAACRASNRRAGDCEFFPCQMAGSAFLWQRFSAGMQSSDNWHISAEPTPAASPPSNGRQSGHSRSRQLQQPPTTMARRRPSCRSSRLNAQFDVHATRPVGMRFVLRRFARDNSRARARSAVR